MFAGMPIWRCLSFEISAQKLSWHCDQRSHDIALKTANSRFDDASVPTIPTATCDGQFDNTVALLAKADRLTLIVIRRRRAPRDYKRRLNMPPRP